jgi:endonuclease YncB( thermonuclease family)
MTRTLLGLFTLLFLAAGPAQAEDSPEPNYVFWAEMDRVVDGNTLSLNLDLGFGVWVHKQSIALLAADGTIPQDEAARQVDQARAKKLRELLVESTDVVVKTIRDKETKPPRYLATIWADGENVNAALEVVPDPVP